MLKEGYEFDSNLIHGEYAGMVSDWEQDGKWTPEGVFVSGKEAEMAISGKYGKVNIPNIGEDEPVFILRAQDKLAEAAILMYQALAASHAAAVAKDVGKEAVLFRKWEGKKKLPD